MRCYKDGYKTYKNKYLFLKKLKDNNLEVVNLEEKVENLDQKIEDELLGNSSSAEMNKLKTSIGKLDKKLDSILKAVQIPFETVPASPAEDNKKNPNT